MTADDWDRLAADPRVAFSSTGSWADAEPTGDDQ